MKRLSLVSRPALSGQVKREAKEESRQWGADVALLSEPERNPRQWGTYVACCLGQRGIQGSGAQM